MENVLLLGGVLWGPIGGALGGICVFILKSAWDRHWRKLDEITAIQKEKAISRIEAQLGEFYLPIYFRLLKDSVIWRKILDRDSDDPLRQRVAAGIERDTILKNHNDLIEIIENKFYLAREDSELADALLKYIRHVSVYNALRKAGEYGTDPYQLGEPWPKELLPVVEEHLKIIQKEYSEILKG